MNTQEHIEKVKIFIENTGEAVYGWVSSAAFYYQLAAISIVIFSALILSKYAHKKFPYHQGAEKDEVGKIKNIVNKLIFHLLLPFLIVFSLNICVNVMSGEDGKVWLLKLAQSLAIIFLLYRLTKSFVGSPFLTGIVHWIGVPLAVLHVFGWLDFIIGWLDNIALSLGDIKLSLYVVLRTLIAGSILFWLGAASNSTGKRIIRTRQSLNIGTREVFAKLFEIAVFVIVFLLLLRIVGINLTALAVFGGALGVGLGFGLQQIASNFISGLIILLDRSVTIGDYIELEDGRSGTLRELNMRYSVIETFDGKDIMVPNGTFITSSYINWSHKDPRQRYALEFCVAYSTDLDLLFDEIRSICTSHPQVISGSDVDFEFLPDAEIAGFGESGINILVEFWMHGVDDGKNRVGADLLYEIWNMIQRHGMEIPYPQREVRILGGLDNSGI